tara:strand:+ start:9235 stop:9528 length:294 start_codon:yes stop_codon:yes gene_type:complete
MNELKYIIVTPNGFNKVMGARAIIFNGFFTHADMVPPRCKVESAGFCTIEKNGHSIATCYGNSESLKVESDPLFDSIIITRTLSKMHPRIGYIETEY